MPITDDSLYKKLCDIIHESLGIPVTQEVSPQSYFQNDLGADSLDVVELIIKVGDEFDISNPDDDVLGLQTVEHLYSYVKEKLITKERKAFDGD